MIITNKTAWLGSRRGKHLKAMLAVGLLAMAAARAERVPMAPEELQRRATHIVVGQVTAVYAREMPKRKGFVDTHYVAEVRPEKWEKGESPAGAALIYVRYWKREWAGIGLPPPDTSGYSSRPKDGERVRMFLTREGYNGFGHTTDGGFTVIGPNGFDRESLPPAPASPASKPAPGGK